MKTALVAIVILISNFAIAYAPAQSGYIKNVIEDDEGIKVVLSGSREVAEGISTVYLENSQPKFMQHKQIILNARKTKTKIIISQDAVIGTKVTVGQ